LNSRVENVIGYWITEERSFSVAGLFPRAYKALKSDGGNLLFGPLPCDRRAANHYKVLKLDPENFSATFGNASDVGVKAAWLCFNK
jgi:hypothetical protein